MSLVPRLEQSHRQIQNGLCLLLGMPPGSLQAELGEPQSIPLPPAEVVVGDALSHGRCHEFRPAGPDAVGRFAASAPRSADADRARACVRRLAAPALALTRPSFAQGLARHTLAEQKASFLPRQTSGAQEERTRTSAKPPHRSTGFQPM